MCCSSAAVLGVSLLPRTRIRTIRFGSGLRSLHKTSTHLHIYILTFSSLPFILRFQVRGALWDLHLSLIPTQKRVLHVYVGLIISLVSNSPRRTEGAKEFACMEKRRCVAFPVLGWSSFLILVWVYMCMACIAQSD